MIMLRPLHNCINIKCDDRNSKRFDGRWWFLFWDNDGVQDADGMVYTGQHAGTL
jgi:hypothetical protein